MTTVTHSALLVLLVASGGYATQEAARTTDQSSSCPMHAKHTAHAHHDGVNARGDKAMGFSHTRTTHHFRLAAKGGSIEVGVNDPGDAESLGQIRSHLRTIAKAFSEGRFDTPMAVHDRVPPGVPVMRQRKGEIAYTYEETESGGRVRIVTENPEALSAVHEFLRFQIEDHRTGDPIDVGTER
jgi:hypothetical protein